MAEIRLQDVPASSNVTDPDMNMWVERDTGGGTYVSERTKTKLVTTPTYVSFADASIVEVGDRVEPDNSSGAVTINLPATPSAGNRVYFTQKYGQPFSVNNLIVGRNGNTIGGLAEDMTVTTDNISFYVVYDGTTWVPVKTEVVGSVS